MFMLRLNSIPRCHIYFSMCSESYIIVYWLDLIKFRRYLSRYCSGGDLILNVFLLIVFEIVCRIAIRHYLVLEVLVNVFGLSLSFPTHSTRCKSFFSRWTSRAFHAEFEFPASWMATIWNRFSLTKYHLTMNQVFGLSLVFLEWINPGFFPYLQITWMLCRVVSCLRYIWVASVLNCCYLCHQKLHEKIN